MSSSTRSMTSRRSSETGSTANGSYPSRVGRPRKHKADIPLLRSRRRARHLPPRFFPRLHPAAGVTGLRATASVEPYADVNVKSWMDAGKIPGPKIQGAGPYLKGEGEFSAARPRAYRSGGMGEAYRSR